MDIRSFFAPKGGAKPPDAKKKDNLEVSQYLVYKPADNSLR